MPLREVGNGEVRGRPFAGRGMGGRSRGRYTVIVTLTRMCLMACAGLVGLVGAGCSSPARGFASADPGARLDAAVDAAARKDRSSIPELIKLLDSDDPAARLVAINTLHRLTGTTNGYDYAAPEAERREAVDRWVAWAGEHKDAGVSRE